MNSIESPLEAQVRAALTDTDVRGVMIFESSEDITLSPIHYGESIVNLEIDLLRHLNEKPLSTEWLEMLRDYCDGRLAARAEGRATGRFITPNPRVCWDMTPIAAAQGVHHG